MTVAYPDVVSFLKEYVAALDTGVESFILDAELVAYDPV